MLKPGGRMLLFDVVFPFGAKGHRAAFEKWISSTEGTLGKEFARETIIHIRDEYSTCDWILEGILERSGFSIDDKKTLEELPGTTYVCTKT
jgi:hypothetical protein